MAVTLLLQWREPLQSSGPFKRTCEVWPLPGPAAEWNLEQRFALACSAAAVDLLTGACAIAPPGLFWIQTLILLEYGLYRFMPLRDLAHCSTN
jgi:hypothetical protein